MLIKKRKNTVPPWKIFILTVVGFGLMLAIAVHSRNEALNRQVVGSGYYLSRPY